MSFWNIDLKCKYLAKIFQAGAGGLEQLVLRGDGVLHHVAVAGPSNIESWKASWAVLANALLMINAVDLGVLNNYRAKIVEFHKT